MKADDVASALDLGREVAGKGEPVLKLAGEVRTETRIPRMRRGGRAAKRIIKVLDTNRRGRVH